MPGVPNTSTFTLADVVAAVLPSSNDLQECFDDSVDGAFDSTYGPGDKSNLLQFRNYGNNIAAQNMVYITQSQLSSSGACSASKTVKAWKGSNPNAVNNGEKFWYNEVVNGVDQPGQPYNGGSEFNFYGIFSGLNAASFKLSSVGIVSNKVFCNLPSLTLPEISYITGYSPSGGLVLSTPVDYYYDSSIGAPENLAPGDILYTDANLTTPLGANTGFSPTRYNQWTNTTTSTDICQDLTNSPGAIIYLTNSTSGVISSIGCAYL
jgi:hypothetical protein